MSYIKNIIINQQVVGNWWKGKKHWIRGDIGSGMEGHEYYSDMMGFNNFLHQNNKFKHCSTPITSDIIKSYSIK